MRINQSRLYAFLTIALAMFIIGSAVNGSAKENEPYKTGLPELTDKELQRQNRHMFKVKKVKLNKLGFKRINRWRVKKRKNKFSETLLHLSKTGDELEVVQGEDTVSEDSFPLPSAGLPGYVDNSQLKYFPPIRSQGSLNSCGVFSGVYYTMTHMHAMAKDLDAKDGGDAFRLSPKWAYNMVNGGANAGTWYYWAYEIGQAHGVATWDEFPYDSNYRSWNLDPFVWESSLYRKFDQYGYVMNTHTQTGIDQVKQMLLNGYVLNFPTYINSWNWKTIGNDPDTTEDDAFAGKRCAYFVNGTSGYHAMTVVGYNDNIWVDINGNNAVDAGEKGAFRIANSWGTGWGESGFAWMAYDALKNPSAVAGGPSDGRVYGWSPSRAHWVTAKSEYYPKLIGRFTVNHLKRDHLRMSIGVSDVEDSSPSTIHIPEMIYNQGGAYGFDGTANAQSATFVYDFTDFLPEDSGIKRYYIGMQDDTTGDEALLESFVLIDVANGDFETSSVEIPSSADNGRVYATVDYSYFDGNTAPVADLYADTISGEAALAVSFDGSGSHDTDGSITSFHWEFGDGASQTGVTVDHIYDSAGIFTATLTVTDDMGATATQSVDIEVMPDPSRLIFVSDLSAELVSEGEDKRASVTVVIMDTDSKPVAGATIEGQWSGLISGEVSAVTRSDGTIAFVSGKTGQAGDITFTVTAVTTPEDTYDPGRNPFSSISVSIEEMVTHPPVAKIQATTVSGAAPLLVTFDATASSDSDDDIVSYQWFIDNGDPFSGDTLVHTFYDPGVIEVVLVVTDAMGNTGTDRISINALSDVEASMHVSKIFMKIKRRGTILKAKAVVIIVDADGSPVENALVSGTWSGIVEGSKSRTTNYKGKAKFLSPKITKWSGTAAFTVENVTAAGYVYDPENNRETQDSIEVNR